MDETRIILIHLNPKRLKPVTVFSESSKQIVIRFLGHYRLPHISCPNMQIENKVNTRNLRFCAIIPYQQNILRRCFIRYSTCSKQDIRSAVR